MRKIIDSTLLVLNILAASAMLVSYLAPLVNPAKFFFPALFGLAYPYLLLVNLIFLCYWLIRLKKQLLISLLVILAGWNHLNKLLPLNLESHKIPVSVEAERIFRVLSYNVRGFDRYHWTEDPNTRDEIFALISQQDPEILCFQEFYASARRGSTKEEVDRMLGNLPYSAVYYAGDPANRSGSGVATYSSYPIVKRSRIPFNTSNAAMYTDLLVHRDTLRVFNIHLQSIQLRKENYAFMDTVKLTYNSQQMREIRSIGSRLKIAFIIRAQQAEMIASYIRDSPHPVLVMGDFNDTPQSFAYREISRGLHDAFRKAGRGFGNTYAGELPSYRIDHILYSDPMIPYECKRVKVAFSDHYPITSVFYIPPGLKAE
jgi:endonuclease/exonuclease/phosphatase family metal-dependent hydrolase